MLKEGPIVIIDDDADDQSFYKTIIRDLGVTNPIVSMKNGEEALVYLETTNDLPFLIFCDINMPFFTGIELKKRIDADPLLRRKSIPFVFYTTKASVEHVEAAFFDITAQGFFEKEMSLDDMRVTIKCIIEYWRRCKHPNSLESLHQTV